MGKRGPKATANLAILLSLVLRLQRMGVPIWLLLPVAGLVLAGMLLWPTFSDRLGDVAGQPPAVESRQPVESTGPGESAAIADFFTEVRSRVFESPAGLRYRPGSAQGHRLKHVMAHAKDQPGRAGPHGVFDADDPAEVFALLDEAFEQAKSGTRTQTRREQGRIIYTVDLGRRIGYVGGQTGNAQGRPAAKRVRMVLDGVDVITAFPVR